MKPIKLSSRFTIHRGKDLNFSSKKDEFLRLIELNKKNLVNIDNDSLWMETNAEIFRGVNDIIKQRITEFTGEPFRNFAEHYWVYTQTKNFNLEWMHQHLLVHPNGRSKIFTDFTFTYYIQQPKNLEGNEGCIIFEDENGVRHSFLPEEGDWFIFPADLRHTAVPTPNCDIDRLVYAGSLCINIEKQQTRTVKNIL